jgi:hypothetical protein
LPTYPSYSRREVEKNIEVILKYFAAKATPTIENKPRRLEIAAIQTKSACAD